MNNMRHAFAHFVFAVFLLVFLPAAAGPAEDYKEARLLYLTAAASLAAYPGMDGDIVMGAVGRDGWEIVPYIQKDTAAKAKFFFASKEVPSKPTEYLLAIAGTSTRTDLKLDLQIGKVFFAGKTFDEFQANATIKPAFPDQVPMVHEGFNRYVQTAFSAETQSDGSKPGRKIVDLMLEHPDSVVYLAGHSAGGSAATLLGARLVSMGVKPGQIKIITFGAPAVGNKVFAEKYEQDLEQIRVVVAGDPIPDLLKVFTRGYQHFGREIRWTTSGYTFDEKHYPNIYLDSAIKNYYDKRSAAAAAGDSDAVLPNETPAVEGARLYIAEINNNLTKSLGEEFDYMREVLLDQYRIAIPAYVIGTPVENDSSHFEALRAKAAEASCDRMVIVNIWGSTQNDPAVYDKGLMSKPDEPYDLIVLEQTVFRVSDGALLGGRTYQKGSKYFTPLGALASAAIAMGSDSAAWSGQ